MVKDDKLNSQAAPEPAKIEKCPHCGIPLTQWEQVILSIDRVLTCKKCWYRIILDVYDEGEEKTDKNSGDKK